MTDHRALKGHTYRRRQYERHRQRHQRIKSEPLRGKLRHRLLHQPGGVSPEHQHLPVRHIDHPQQSIGDRQPERGQQQNGAQRQPHKRLPQQVAYRLTMLDLAQAFRRGLAYFIIRLRLGAGIGQQAGLHFRIARFSQQRHRLLAHRGLRAGQLQTGNGEAQHFPHPIITFTRQLAL